MRGLGFRHRSQFVEVLHVQPLIGGNLRMPLRIAVLYAGIGTYSNQFQSGHLPLAPSFVRYIIMPGSACRGMMMNPEQS